MKALRRLLVVVAAVSLPLAGGAQAPAAAPAAPLVQLYGSLNVNMQYTGAEGATTAANNVKPRFAISVDSSNIGVRGTAEISGSFKGTYQCETAANIDGEGVSGICNRNSRVGLTSDFGTLFYGNWDTPYKAGTYGTNADDPFGSTDVFGFNGLMGSPGYGSRSAAAGGAAATTASFDLRAANSLGYWTPKFSGLSAKLQISMDEFAGANGLVRPSIFSGVVNFDMGGLSVLGQAEYHEDYFGIRVINAANAGNSAAKDMAFRLAAGYTLPLGETSNLNVMGMFEQLSYTQDNAVAGFKSYSRPSYLLGARWRAGDHELAARYSAAMKPSIKAATGTTLAAGAEDQLGANNITLGYNYYLTKSTKVFLFWTKISNEDRARYIFGVSGNAAVNTVPAGSDPTAMGLGIKQTF